MGMRSAHCRGFTNGTALAFLYTKLPLKKNMITTTIEASPWANP